VSDGPGGHEDAPGVDVTTGTQSGTESGTESAGVSDGPGGHADAPGDVNHDGGNGEQ